MSCPVHDIVQEDMVVIDMREQPLGVLALLRLFLLGVELGELLNWVGRGAGHYQDNWGGVWGGRKGREGREEREGKKGEGKRKRGDIQ